LQTIQDLNLPLLTVVNAMDDQLEEIKEDISSNGGGGYHRGFRTSKS
jgi:hypothetical protein